MLLIKMKRVEAFLNTESNDKTIIIWFSIDYVRIYLSLSAGFYLVDDNHGIFHLKYTDISVSIISKIIIKIFTINLNDK